ncbi:hypothetical protein L484_006906 [Morus notabilis]|uniref:Uncharacterized protein n=1 Tax=Morus notabilis TaxID=981085 RepID=W9RQX2_9ROSA|nr:hypothetical protein L484_006906 [Morus notabilis]
MGSSTERVFPFIAGKNELDTCDKNRCREKDATAQRRDWLATRYVAVLISGAQTEWGGAWDWAPQESQWDVEEGLQ